MSAARDRKEAARKLGVVLGAQYRQMQDASGPDAITEAATKLGQTFNDNLEFICWCLKEYGGMQQMPISRSIGTLPTTGKILLKDR